MCVKDIILVYEMMFLVGYCVDVNENLMVMVIVLMIVGFMYVVIDVLVDGVVCVGLNWLEVVKLVV